MDSCCTSRVYRLLSFVSLLSLVLQMPAVGMLHIPNSFPNANSPFPKLCLCALAFSHSRPPCDGQSISVDLASLFTLTGSARNALIGLESVGLVSREFDSSSLCQPLSI